MGREQTLSSICLTFWIPASCGLICPFIKHCLYCKREKAVSVTPFIANVPSDRLCFNEEPFTNTGVDYLVPYQIKLLKGTRSNQATTKRYIVLFTCLSTRAVHLEIAGDLSTDFFILSLRRFLARSGTVKVMRSDNRTNFVGALTELKQSITALDQVSINKHLVAKNIDWKINPPVSPWMEGGI